MKKTKITLAVILAVLVGAALASAGAVFQAYNNIGTDAVPRPTVEVMGAPLSPVNAEWREPVPLPEILSWSPWDPGIHKDLAWEEPGAAADLGEVGQAPLALLLSLSHPDGFADTLKLTKDGAVLFDGTGVDLTGIPKLAEGTYELAVDSVRTPSADGRGHGKLSYRCVFSVAPAPEPELRTGRLELQQGDILSLKLLHVPEGTEPKAETDLGMAVFLPAGEEGAWFAAVPVGNTRKTGVYAVRAFAGDKEFTVDVTVLAFDFDQQNLIIDTSDPVISEANSPAAYREYRAKIPPLYPTFDTERYWEGTFDPPATGRISTEFGEIRYTNGDYSNPRSHNGMDIAVPTGTPVTAPNAGRVVLAERLLNTGNTIVIEHGGGLKSYYFHMSRIDVTPGDMVKKGDLIGAVGSTGYSTGPHLHYEMRIGDQPVSPSMLFDAGAGLYGAEE
ncbi:MAG: M23 family metallopeptidase [Clostridiales Family XIII bacterium]|jgi:murein DD-endopeptidase MepM/ murein hydrolase activator NlpD|nr:M23 family metallopeptidase [Clostridiales Family XIII bacterium]